MAISIIQAQYDILEKIAHQFDGESGNVELMLRTLRQIGDRLESGGWEGDAAQAFYAEMNGEVFPALVRLQEALQESGEVTKQIAQIIQSAEQEAANQFTLERGGNHQAGNGGTGNANTIPTGEGNWRLTNEKVFGNFSEENMDKIASWQPTINQSQAGDAMKALFEQGRPNSDVNSLEVQKQLQILVDAYNDPAIDMAYMENQYRRYLELEAEMFERIEASSDMTPPAHIEDGLKIPVIGTLEYGRQDYWGSTTQMRFGRVVGDSLGIDPVFGALLSPTGGTPGIGNQQNFIPNPESAIAQHGTFHDGAGFLQKYFGVDPGYDYLGLENAPYGSPLAGQQTGINYWNERISAPPEGTLPVIGEYLTGEQEETLTSIVGTSLRLKDEVDQFGSAVSEQIDSISDDIESGLDYVVDSVSDSWNSLFD